MVRFYHGHILLVDKTYDPSVRNLDYCLLFLRYKSLLSPFSHGGKTIEHLDVIQPFETILSIVISFVC